MQNTKIYLMDERCNILEKSNINFATALKTLWNIKDCENKYPFLVGIDPYGNTYFNVHQSPQVVEELKKLLPKTKHKTARDVIEQTIDFMGKTEQHQYIKFIGD